MGAEFTRLFTLQENLYAEGAPLLIEAGALLKHNESGRVIAQLKLRNLDNHRIKAAKVRFIAYDTAGKPLNEEIEYEYLDVNAARNERFGEQNAVFFTSKSVRNYEAIPFWACMDDGSEWCGDGEKWESLPRPEELKSRFENDELVKQFRMKYGTACKNLLLETKDLWYCSCGEINRASEDKCGNCGTLLEKLRTFDIDELCQDCEKRLEKESIEAELARAASEAKKAEMEKKAKKILPIAIPAVLVVVALILLSTKVFIPSSRYSKAENLLAAEEYTQAAELYEKLGDYKDSASKAKFALNAEEYIEACNEAQKLLDKGEKALAAMAYAKIDGYDYAKEKSLALWDEIAIRDTIGAMTLGSFALREDGRVMATKYEGDAKYNYGLEDAGDWENIIAISTNGTHILGLKADGTVIAAGNNKDGQCNVSDWEDIVAISAGYQHSMGLKADGTVVAVGNNEEGQCNVSDWKDIVAIGGGYRHSVGLKADGRVVASGRNMAGECDVSSLKDIVAVGAGDTHTVALKADGRVVALGYNFVGECSVSGWKDIVSISVGGNHTVGIRSDGTVMVTEYTGDKSYDYGQYDVKGWNNVVAIDAGYTRNIVLLPNGTVQTRYSGPDESNHGANAVDGWSNIKFPEVRSYTLPGT